MRKKFVWIAIGILLIIVMVISACAKTTSTTPATTSASKPAATTSSIAQPQPSVTTSTSGPATTTAPQPTGPAPAKNWWDKDGTPQTGGTINLPTFRTGSLEGNMDNWNMMDYGAGWFDVLFDYDWTVDRNEYGFQVGWVPEKYTKGCLAESWEWNDAQTLTVHLLKGVKWQNKAPVNGREFTAQDVQYHYDWLMGKISGFTEPSPTYIGMLSTIQSVEATDKNTVVFHFKNPSLFVNMCQVYDPGSQKFASAPEWVAQNDRGNWKNAVGTGPFILTDFVAATSETLSKNPDYWGYDERYPQNKLPYADAVKLYSIPDNATSVAAMRTGKIDIMMELNAISTDQLFKTNPDMLKKSDPLWSETAAFRIDKGPFSDIRVRQAMQLCLDRETIAKSLWGTDGKPCGQIPPVYKGFADEFDKWPQDLKDEYSYNLGKARQLMTEAGYPNGFKTNIIAASNNDMELLQVDKAMFAELGVDMEIVLMDGPAGREWVNSRKHDAMTVGMGGVGTPPLMSVENNTAQRNNNACWNDPTYEAMANDFRASASTEEAMKKANDINYYLLRQHLTTGPLPKVGYNVWQPYLKGYNGEGGPSFYGMRGWYYARFWIDQSLK